LWLEELVVWVKPWQRFQQREVSDDPSSIFALLMTQLGAHVTIFGRSPGPLDDAAEEIRKSCPDSLQEINAVVVDLSDYIQVSPRTNLCPRFHIQKACDFDIEQVDNAFRKQARVPDVLYCAAGGNHAQNGFFVDIISSQIEDCMHNNYFATAYPAKSALDLWIQDDRNNECGRIAKPTPRQIVIVSSAAAFVALPGSIAYTRTYSHLLHVTTSLTHVSNHSCQGSRSGPCRHTPTGDDTILMCRIDVQRSYRVSRRLRVTRLLPGTKDKDCIDEAHARS
jgi:NAD(P)-dependent dehydrogenase (short-subunit alcohol dehydrogenase family)